jgi:alkylation response protein AidB-like acyl-CoA dehydrogenase
VDIEFTPEQELLGETVRSLAGRLGPRSTQDLETADPDLGWAAICELGLPGLRLPEPAGGSGALVTDVMIVVEELARGLVPVPFLGPVLAAELLRLAGAPTSVLSEIASGEIRYTVALDRSLRSLGRVGDPTAVAWDSHGASGAVALDNDSRVCVVQVADRLECADQARTAHRVGSDVLMDGAELGARLAPAALASWGATALGLLAADLLGAMESTLAGAVTYSRERIQFDQPIGSFQAVQHLCADAHVATEALRSGVWYAAWAADALTPDEALAAARVAKAYAAETAVGVAETAIQVHGGIAITWDTLPHLFLRRCLLTRQILGDENDHYAGLAASAKPVPA